MPAKRMQWSYLELRRRLIEAELWPRGRMSRLACYLAGSAIVLYALRKLLGLFAPSWGAHLGGWVGFLAFVAAVLFFILGFRWVKRRILWRLRNRLIVTYMFIGVIPAVLLVAMGLITLYGLGGQFAVFLVTSEIHSQLRSMAGVNDAVSNALAARLERGEAPAAESLAGLRKRDPAWQRRHVCAWYGNKPLPLCNDFGGASLTYPEFMKGSFQDMVHDGGQLYLRVGSSMQVAGNKLTVVTGEPFDKDLVSKIASDLGEITLYTPAIKKDAESKPPRPRFVLRQGPRFPLLRTRTATNWSSPKATRTIARNCRLALPSVPCPNQAEASIAKLLLELRSRSRSGRRARLNRSWRSCRSLRARPSSTRIFSQRWGNSFGA